MKEIKNKIEAILFTTGRFMDLEEISNICGIASQGMVKEAINELIKEYHERDNSLQIIKEDNKFMLNIKKQYNHLTTKLLNDSELDMPTQESLAIIAYKQPMLQCDLVKIRGNTAYEHVKVLKEQNFIISEKHGRTRMLKLAQKFYDYFDVVETEKLKNKFQEVEEKVLPLEIKEETQQKLTEINQDSEDNEIEEKTNENEEKIECEDEEKTNENDKGIKNDLQKPLGSISFED